MATDNWTFTSRTSATKSLSECSSCYLQHYVKPKSVQKQLSTAWQSQIDPQCWLSINLLPRIDGMSAITGQTAGVTKASTIAPVTTIITNVTTAANHVTDELIHDNHGNADKGAHPTITAGNRAEKDTTRAPGSVAAATSAEGNTRGRLHITETDMIGRPHLISTLYTTMTTSQKTRIRTRVNTAPILRHRYV